MMGAAGQETMAAGALHAYFRIIGMGCCFHNRSNPLRQTSIVAGSTEIRQAGGDSE
jgi:hypothetical protein